MKATVVIAGALVAALATAPPAQVPEKPEAGPGATVPGPSSPNARAWLEILVGHMGNPDPRIRLSVREALRVMGPQAIAAVNAGMAGEKNPHVKAFMTRTVTYLKIARDRQEGRAAGTRFWDIDHVAAATNLTWEQMDKVLPVLVKAYQDNRALTAAFREAGGDRRDPEAVKALREEMKAVASDAEAKLKEILDPKQLALMRRYYDPWSQRDAQERGRSERGREKVPGR